MQTLNKEQIGAKRRRFLRFSNSSNCETDVFEMLIQNIFGCEIGSYTWGQASVAFGACTDPACLIVCQGLKAGLRSSKKLLASLSKNYPTVQVLWLVPDLRDNAYWFRELEEARPRVKVIDTNTTRETVVKEILDTIEKISGVKRVMTIGSVIV